MFENIGTTSSQKFDNLSIYLSPFCFTILILFMMDTETSVSIMTYHRSFLPGTCVLKNKRTHILYVSNIRTDIQTHIDRD